MRTRKHQSPVESNWVDKHKQCEETPRAGNEGQPGLAAPTTTATEQGAASESPQRDPSENSANADHKKANGKKQKRRKKSPRNKSQLPKVDCMLAGLMADNVWLEKRVYEEAERAHHAALAADLARAIATKPSVPEANAHGAAEGTVTNCGGLPQRSCNHSSATACHHVDNSIWVNKFTFDDAEGQFVSRFTSPLAPRALGLPLASPTRPAQRISDEGYVSATPTPATQELRVIGSAVAPAAPTGTTVNGKPHWAGLQDTMAEVWLEKPSYDRAERNFYESLASQQSLQKTEPSNHWSFHSGKKGKKDKASRKSAGKAQPAGPKRERPRIPEEGIGRLNCPVYYFLHQDSENVWLNKPAYDKAEETFYEIQALKPQPATKKPTAAKTRKPAKCKGHAAPRSAKKMAAPFLSTEKVWLDKYKFDDAERQYYEHLSKRPAPEASNQQKEDGASTILRDIARARENIQKSLAGSAAASQTSGGESGELLSRVANLEQENQNLHKVVKDLQLAISKLESRLATLEKSAASAPAACTPAAPVQNAKAAPEAPAPKQEEEDDDDDIDLFGSDEEEDAEAARIKEERLRQYAEKKSKKPGLIAKSSILLDVKPWDDETDMAKLEECVRSVQMEGLLWGSSKLVPVGYGIKKLQIQCVVEDDKVGTDILEEEITKFENYVQSVDIAAFNKI